MPININMNRTQNLQVGARKDNKIQTCHQLSNLIICMSKLTCKSLPCFYYIYKAVSDLVGNKKKRRRKLYVKKKLEK